MKATPDLPVNDLLDGLSTVLGTLASSPHPDELAAVMAEELRPSLGVHAVALMAARPPRLIVLGVHGYERTEVEDLDWIPLDGDYPVPRAFHEAEILIETSTDMPARYAGMRRPSARWSQALARVPDGCTVSAPIFASGRPVGGYGLLTDKTDWNTLDLSALDALSHALGLWLTHPDSGFVDDRPGDRPSLTDRQLGIVSMAAGGMGNAAIGRALGVSESTVKQELTRIRRLLDVDDRSALIERARALGLIAGDAQ